MRRAFGATQWTPTEWTFDGSNDDSSWTTLDTKASGSNALIPEGSVVGATDTQDENFGKFTISVPGLYRYYRLNVTGGSTYTAVGELVLYGV